MKYFSLFSGIGGFELGILNASQTSWLQQRGHLENMSDLERPKFPSEPFCVGFSEIDRYAISIYKKHFSNHKEYGNVTNIKCSDVSNFDLLCGGFPCQSFSIAGKRGGFGDTRGTLFFEIARIAQEKQPRLLLLENVKGLLSHDKGRTFGTILNTLDELGYDLQWQVLNSKNFGVPQNRERVFIIGHLRTTSRPQVFPLSQSSRKSDAGTQRQTSGCIKTGEGNKQNDNTYIVQALDANYAKGCAGFAGTTRATAIQNRKIRRLTPTECERLQGFPDGWTSGISDTQRYKCLGNAVTVNVISAIIEKLIFTT
jgi:DNA (cytosine-5)-methyltransferase 1